MSETCGAPPFAATASPRLKSRKQPDRTEQTRMTTNIKAVQNGFVGEVTGIDICKPLSGADVAAIERGMDEYAVLTFPDQPLTDEQQVAFTGNFGELEITLAGQMAKPEERRFQQLELGDISNFNGADTSRLRARDDKRRMYALANRLWHSD